jgi:hypothetical protein
MDKTMVVLFNVFDRIFWKQLDESITIQYRVSVPQTLIIYLLF